MGDTKSAAEIFQEKIEEIDQELNKLDPKAELSSNKIANTGKEKLLESLAIANTGKENILEALSIHESTPLVTQVARANQPQLKRSAPRVPLSVLPDRINIPENKVATWKRINRTDMGTDVIIEDFMGEKRSADIFDSQTELLKKRKVSPGGKNNNEILAELEVSSSARSNESLVLEHSGAWEPTNGKLACRDHVG